MNWRAHTNITNEQQKDAFALAAKQVQEEANAVDKLLWQGQLESLDCCNMIETAANITCYTNDTLHADVLAERCNWHFPHTEDEYWAYLSAKAFIDVASKLNLVISFTC